jgi:hypothetical protein
LCNFTFIQYIPRKYPIRKDHIYAKCHIPLLLQKKRKSFVFSLFIQEKNENKTQNKTQSRCSGRLKTQNKSAPLSSAALVTGIWGLVVGSGGGAEAADVVSDGEVRCQTPGSGGLDAWEYVQ